jgi:signal transduction histidine kinase
MISNRRSTWTFWPNPPPVFDAMTEKTFSWSFILKVSLPTYGFILVHAWSGCDLRIIFAGFFLHIAFALFLIVAGVERYRTLRLRFAHFTNALLALTIPLSTTKPIFALWIFFAVAVWLDAFYSPKSWFSIFSTLLLPWADPVWNWNSPQVDEKIIYVSLTIVINLVVYVLAAYAGTAAHSVGQNLSEQKSQSDVLTERERIGRSLHGTLGSALSEIALWHDVALASPDRKDESLVRAQARARSALADLRSLVADMDVSQTATLAGIAEGVRKQTQGLCEASDTVLDLSFDGEAVLDQNAAYHAAKIAVEAVTNAVRHGQPKRVSVKMAASPLSIKVDDDGAGFDPESVTQGRGLRSLREHALALDGTLKIESAPGRGTRVIVDVPRGA